MAYPFVSRAEFARIKARIKAKKEKRSARVADNAELSGKPRPGARNRKIPAKTLRRRAVARNDHLFSLAVRKRDFVAFGGRCPFGCGKPIQCAFHFVTRAKYSVRWDMRNAVGSCHGCNFRYEFDPHFAVTWFIENRGLPAYDELIRDGNRIAKHSQAQLEEIGASLKQQLEAVG